jgi:N-acetylglutamate synthase-like GNAT family acetyltransferase
MAITYQVEKYHEICDEIHVMWREHWEEVYFDKDIIKFNPDYDKFKLLSESDILHTVTVRENGEVIGYHISLIYPHIHSKSSLTCFTDMFFVRKDKRKGLIGIKLLKFVEQSLKGKGIQKIYMGSKSHIDISIILERLGYTYIEKLYTKVI